MARKNSQSEDKFVQEYLYIEEYPLEILKEQKSKKNDDEEEVERGVIIIDLM